MQLKTSKERKYLMCLLLKKSDQNRAVGVDAGKVMGIYTWWKRETYQESGQY